MFNLSLPNPKLESRSDKYILENLKSSRISTMLASANNAYLDSPSLSSIFDLENYHGHDTDTLYLKQIQDSKAENQKLTEKSFHEKYSDCGLNYDSNFSSAIVDKVLEKKRKMDINNYIISHGKSDLLDKSFQVAGSIVGGNLAPVNLGINVATSLFPLGKVLKGAWWLSNPVKNNMVKFAIGGGIGQAALEPLIKKERNLEQREYTLDDSLQNIAESIIFSAAMPGLAHTIKSTYSSTKLIAKGNYQKFRNKYFVSPEELNPIHSTNSSSLNAQFKHFLDELSVETFPKEAKKLTADFGTAEKYSIESLEIDNATRRDIREKGAKLFPEFFVLEDQVAFFEDYVHKDFVTGYDVTKLPTQLHTKLKDGCAES